MPSEKREDARHRGKHLLRFRSEQPTQVDEQAVEHKRVEIRDSMARLGQRIASGDDSELLPWVIPGASVCPSTAALSSHHAGSRVSLPNETLPLN